MNIKNNCSAPKQMAYARKVFSGDIRPKTEIAVECGYSPNVSRSVRTHIENTNGFKNAMSVLATEASNIAIGVMEEIDKRGYKDLTNKELLSTINVMSSAWSRFILPEDEDSTPATNKLRTVILQQVENQTIDTNGEVSSSKRFVDVSANPIIQSQEREAAPTPPSPPPQSPPPPPEYDF
jgi:predicted transcriptional regulator with HTH domain